MEAIQTMLATTEQYFLLKTFVLVVIFIYSFYVKY